MCCLYHSLKYLIQSLFCDLCPVCGHEIAIRCSCNVKFAGMSQLECTVLSFWRGVSLSLGGGKNGFGFGFDLEFDMISESGSWIFGHLDFSVALSLHHPVSRSSMFASIIVDEVTSRLASVSDLPLHALSLSFFLSLFTSNFYFRLYGCLNMVQRFIAPGVLIRSRHFVCNDLAGSCVCAFDPASRLIFRPSVCEQQPLLFPVYASVVSVAFTFLLLSSLLSSS